MCVFSLLSEGDALAVGARVVPALLVHRLDMRLQVALRLEGDAGAVGAHFILYAYVSQEHAMLFGVHMLSKVKPTSAATRAAASAALSPSASARASGSLV